MSNNIAIVGGGASGLFTSILLAREKFNVTIFEANNKIGKKLLATGNGRCNITNTNLNLQHFHSTNKNFINHTLEQFDYKKLKSFFNTLGIEFSFGQNNRVYPMSLQASTVVELLEYEAKQLGVNIQLNSFIDSIMFANNKFLLNNHDKFDKVIISTGGIAMPKLGSNDSGYKFAKQFGHKIINPFPTLVQLVCDDKNLDMISGVKIEGKIENITGDILFTKYGLSGSAILDASRNIASKLQHKKSVIVSIDILPHITQDRLTELLTSGIDKRNEKSLTLWLNKFINKKLASYIINSAKISQNIRAVKFLSKNDIIKIVKTIKNLTFTVINTRGFETSEVTAGGVDVSGIDTYSMQSKHQKNLYFTGEVLDVDGDCGGFNLHWAWASGYIASQNIIKNHKG